MNHVVAWTATGLLIPILVIFVAFAAHFYLKLVAHKSEVRKNDTTYYIISVGKNYVGYTITPI